MRNDILDAVIGMCAAQAGSVMVDGREFTDSPVQQAVLLIELFSEHNGDLNTLKEDFHYKNKSSRQIHGRDSSLVQIMPLVFELRYLFGENFISKDSAQNMISGITKRIMGQNASRIACGIYLSVASKLIGKRSPKLEVEEGIREAMQYYRTHAEYALECRFFEHFCDSSFPYLKKLEVMTTDSSVTLLEAALWCIRNTDNFRDCIHLVEAMGENAVLSALTGSLAGICYGIENIPTDWIGQIKEKSYIYSLCEHANEIYMKENIQKLDQILETMKLDDNRKTAQIFSRVVADSDLICYDYFEILKSYGIQGKENLARIIEGANLESVLAILTSLIRKDHFQNRFLESSLEAGIVQLVVNRLKTLVVC